jgi:uncharacterized protein (TIGR02646 family)
METRKLQELYEASPEAYRDGSERFDFDSSLYGAKSVKNALLKAQHDKCCFCESKVTHVAYGDVEHYRPKAGYRQAPDEPLGRPGYYWLAYDWSNLMFCCQVCNQRFKGNLFPLVDPALRARTHHDDLTSEAPLFLHPGIDDPAEYLDFREEYLFPIGGNPRGATTIEALGLNREPLAKVRRDHLALFRTLVDARKLLAIEVARQANPDPEFVKKMSELDALVARFVQDSAQYAAMARAALRSSGGLCKLLPA